MKNFLSLVFFLNFLNHTSSAQVSKDIPAFGKIDTSELKMTDCAFSPGASGVNLLKYEEVTLSVFPNSTTQVVTSTRYRIKILKKGGFIRISPVEKSDIFEIKTTKEKKTITFTFPQVKEGSVIEYQFTRKDKR